MGRNLQPFEISVERRGERGMLTGFQTADFIDAKAEAEREFGPGVCTVAVMRAGKVVDVFDGQWSSDWTNDE